MTDEELSKPTFALYTGTEDNEEKELEFYYIMISELINVCTKTGYDKKALEFYDQMISNILI